MNAKVTSPDGKEYQIEIVEVPNQRDAKKVALEWIAAEETGYLVNASSLLEEGWNVELSF